MFSSQDREDMNFHGQGRVQRALVALAWGLAAGIVALTAASGITGSIPAAVSIAALAVPLVAWTVWKRPPIAIDEAAATRGLKIVSALATILALVLLARLAVFMIDPSKVAYSIVPTSEWEVRHSCLSAYFVAGRAVEQGHDLYDNALYSAPDDNPAKPRKALRIGPFNIDVYEYPPPFLLLPRALLFLTPDFTRLRMLWFALNLAVLLLAIPVAARFLGRAAATRAMLLSPLLLAAVPTLSVLQKGNVQLMVIALSVIAMALMARRRWAAGGALLAYAAVSKLFPGLLVVYLAARRQWRAVVWTAVMGAACVALTLLLFGWAPFAGFLRHIPGLLGGEAFPAFRNPAAMAINFSVPGLVFKLKLFGVPGMGFPAAKAVGWVWTLVVAWLVVRAGRSARSDAGGPLVWLSILILGTLRSPFLPQGYAAFPPIWLLTLLAATAAPTRKALFLVLLGWFALNVSWPMDWPIDPRFLAIANLVPQGATIAVAILGLRRAPESQAIAT